MLLTKKLALLIPIVVMGESFAVAVPEKAQVLTRQSNPFAKSSASIVPGGLNPIVNAAPSVGVKSQDSDEAAKSENEISLQPLVYPKTFPELMEERRLKSLTKKFCKKYRGKYVGHYSEIYLVKNCERRLLEGPDSHFKLTQRGTKIHTVDPKVMAAIPLGKAMESIQNRNFKGCKHYERKYVTYRDVDVYYVKKCRKLLLPTWESYLIHRTKYGKGVKTLIHNLSWEEFIGLEEGDIIDSKITAKIEARKLESVVEPFVDVVPISKACRGLSGKFVSYYSRVYKISNCKKREIDSALFSQKFKKVVPKELTSDQWISLPNGKDLKL